MALTRAQLLMGNSSQGTVLSGQVQAVKAGAGIAIAADGTISVDSQSIVGVMKLGQTAATAAAAYNSYEWPTTTGSVGQQLTINAISGTTTTLKWDDPDMIPWTAKGQLVVGTGVNTQTILNVGTDGQILIADSAQASGLNYTSNYVATTGSTSSALIPAGITGARPITPATGAFRYNSTLTSLEFFNGASWEIVPSSTGGLFVEESSATGSAFLPAGTTAQRDAAPSAGYFRYNSSNALLEFWNGASWQSVASSSTGLFVDKTSSTGSAVMPTGTTAQRDGAPVAGYTRFNSSITALEYWDGTTWSAVTSSANLGLGLSTNGIYTVTKITEATVPPTIGTAKTQAILGSTYYDTNLGATFMYYSNGGAPVWTQI